MKSGDKVCIGMVNNGTMSGLLAQDLIHIAKEKSGRFDHLVQVANIGLTTRSRNLVVKTFLETTKSQWLLMVDSDERLSVETWLKLVDSAHHIERPIMSGLVFAAFFDNKDNLRPIPTIYKMDMEKGLEAIDGYPINEIIEVDAVGTGCLLIHRDVLLDMQKQATQNQGKDWAWFVEGAINGQYFGEDLLFSKRLKSMGYKIHAHTGAILPHQKQFWLDDRHHTLMRNAALNNYEASDSNVPLANESDALTSKE
jgi:hypothetical protein